VTRRIEVAPAFERDLKRLGRRYRGIREDLEPLIEQLVDGATPGDRVQAVRAVVYKVRLSNRDARRGKSGGYRVIYYLPTDDVTILLTIYSKTDQTDLPAREIALLLEEARLG